MLLYFTMRGRKRKIPADFVPAPWITSDEEDGLVVDHGDGVRRPRQGDIAVSTNSEYLLVDPEPSYFSDGPPSVDRGDHADGDQNLLIEPEPSYFSDGPLSVEPEPEFNSGDEVNQQREGEQLDEDENLQITAPPTVPMPLIESPRPEVDVGDDDEIDSVASQSTNGGNF